MLPAPNPQSLKVANPQFGSRTGSQRLTQDRLGPAPGSCRLLVAADHGGSSRCRSRTTACYGVSLATGPVDGQEQCGLFVTVAS